MQPLKQDVIYVTLAGIVGTVVSDVQSLKQADIYVTLAGIVGTVVSDVQL